MARFLTHESIANQLFSLGFCVATPQQVAWTEQLTNCEKTLLLMCERMESDYTKLTAKMRRPWSTKDVVPELVLVATLKICTACFLCAAPVSS